LRVTQAHGSYAVDFGIGRLVEFIAQYVWIEFVIIDRDADSWKGITERFT
jgi:hypothetical protein